jgi:phage gpG-like protein
MFERTYQNTNNVIIPDANKTYVSFDQYWNFADIPHSNAPISAMGFLGLQTETKNNLPSGVKNALFDSYGSASKVTSGAVGGRGGLYN